MNIKARQSIEEEIGYVDEDNNEIIYPFLNKSYRLKPEEEVRMLMLKKLILEYGYMPEEIDIEIPVKSGRATLKKRADIVVFDSTTIHDPADHAYIIVEVKKKKRTDGIDQMQTYCNNTTAEFGVWFNGTNIVYQHRTREPHHFLDIPDIPRKGETLEEVGVFRKNDLIAATELTSVFETINNHIFANQQMHPEKRFAEIVKLIFVKMHDEKRLDDKCEFRITESELRQVDIDKGAHFAGRIQALFDKVKNEYKDVFDQNDKIKLKPSVLAFAVSQLQKFSLRDTEADVKGTAFQTFVHAEQRGERGEFFTPNPVIRMMVKMMDPGDDDMLLDPACGTGSFLVNGMNHVWDKYRKRPNVKDIDLLKYAHNHIRGIDSNADIAKVAKMNLILYDDGHTGVFSADSLESWDVIQKEALKAGVLGIEPESADLILTNPPFGSKGKVDNKAILSQFDLAHKWRKNSDTNRYDQTKNLQDGQIPDILFIERCLQFLRPGGRLGIVLPNSDLNNLSLEYVRQFIKDNSRIIAVVSLPAGTFMSAGSNPRPSVLFLQKLDKEAAEALNAKDYPIFMAFLNKIGYDLNTKTAPIVYKKDESGGILKDSDGEPIVDSEIPEILENFQAFRKRHKIRFRENENLVNLGV
jgi:type I restriction enzyme M protein